MTKASDNPFPSILVTEGTVPATPAAGKQRLYIDSTTHVLKYVNSSGTASNVSTGSGATVATDTIWDAAGDLAVGSGADTAAKLTKGSAGGALTIINSAVAWNSGTSFPGSKATGDRYWRTDLALECYWDGTRWLTTTLFRMDMDQANGISANTVVARATPHHTTYDLWLETFLTSTLPSTIDGSNYWTIALRKITATISVSTVVTFNTNADTTDNYTTRATAIGAALGTTNKVLDVLASKVLSPGALSMGSAVLYRLIVT